MSAATNSCATLGTWLRLHWQMIAHRDGTLAVAKRLRKQGIPVDIAVAILARRGT